MAIAASKDVENPAFRHEALLYAGDDEFVTAASAFIREGLSAKERILVVIAERKIEMLRRALGGAADSVYFADMNDVGSNPARIIPAWQEFVDEHGGAGQGLRGIGEPIFPERGPDELIECQRHEDLLNVAFHDGQPWRLLCPYDTTALDPLVVAEARRSHPYVTEEGSPRRSETYRGLDAITAPFAPPLPDPGTAPHTLLFGTGDLPAVRRFVAQQADDAGLDDETVAGAVAAVNEIVTNSLRHGGGGGSLRVWQENGFVCEIRDRGFIRDPLAGRRPPSDADETARGLWMANQLCDLVQVRSSDSGTVVRIHMRHR